MSAPFEALVNIQTPRQRSTHAQVVHTLGTGIVLGRYREGETLPEADLIQQFGVSRTVLREGMKTLAAKGMVRSKTKIGTKVTERTSWNMFDPDVLTWYLEGGIDRRFLRDLADIRLAVEPMAAALAAARRTPADLLRLGAVMDDMRRETVLARFADADLQFHLALASVSGNLFMHSIGAVIETALLVSFKLSAPVDPAQRATSVVAHQKIVDAIEAEDAEAAAAATRAVIEQGLRRHGALDAPP